MTRLADESLTAQQLTHRADVVEGMVDHAGWAFVKDDLERQITSVQARILAGKLSHESYLDACGVLRGLQTALNLPDSLIVRPPDQDEEPR